MTVLLQDIRHGLGVLRKNLGVSALAVSVIALGANQTRILSLVLRQGLGLAAVGVMIGTLGSLAVNRLMGSMLFGVQPNDPVTSIGVAAALLAVACAACAVPAWSASRTRQVSALRHE